MTINAKKATGLPRVATAVAVVKGYGVIEIKVTNGGTDIMDVEVLVAPPNPGATPVLATGGTIGISQRADITGPDIAVDSYALSSAGTGTGYVRLVFGNGTEFADEADPVNVQIIKVSEDLYTGDAKTLLASNPLDEQVVLRHSGDFGRQPENFEFEWRYDYPNAGLRPPQR